MDKEYLMAASPQFTFDLGRNFDNSIADKDHRYLVSDIPEANADIYAPEMQFYLKHSEDDLESKQANILKLYTARSVALDLSQNIEFSTYVGNRVALITTSGHSSLKASLEDAGFAFLHIPCEVLSSVTGQIGELKIICLIDGEETTLYTDQILWQNRPQDYAHTSGVYDLPSLINPIETLENNRGNIKYTNSIKYVSATCLHHHKREDICHKCVDVCPTHALSIQSKEKQIELSHIHCNECGACVSLCPSGSLDFAPLPRKSFKAIAGLYKDRIALISSEIEQLAASGCTLKANILPLALSTTHFLDENHLLTLLQETGYGVIIYTTEPDPHLENIVHFINDIFIKKYGKKAVYICANVNEIASLSLVIPRLAEVLVSPTTSYSNKRQEFSQRLALIVAGDELGTITPGPHLDYGNMVINQDNCSLCLSCADACSSGALIVHAEDNSLRYNPSLCTQCGYCEKTCPEEDCLSLQPQILTLSPSYFTEKIMARDELFACIECGVQFAPKKAVTKVIKAMTPIFGQDSLRIKSLSCCSDCKARLMLEAVTVL